MSVIIGTVHRIDVVIWVKNRTEFTLCLCRASVALGGPDIDVSTLLLKSLGIDPCL